MRYRPADARRCYIPARSPKRSCRSCGSSADASATIHPESGQARIDACLLQEDFFSKWGLKDDCGTLAHAENGNRVIPYKYRCRHLEGLGLKAVLVRPGLIDWNPISRTKTPEQMRLEIGETVYRWHRKELVKEED